MVNKNRLIVFAFAILLICIAGYFYFLSYEKSLKEIDNGVVAFKNGAYDEGLRILSPHAEKGNETAGLILGEAYLHGLGVERDRNKAREWMKRSSERKAAESFLWIAKTYEKGDRLFKKDINEAIEWYKFAVQEGSQEAEQRLSELNAK